MTFTFVILAALTAGSAAAAMALRKPVHCALAVALAFAGLALLYLNLGADFVAFAQILVYVGAVAILVVFAVLLTPGEDSGRSAGGRWWFGVGLAALLFALLSKAITGSALLKTEAAGTSPAVTVKALGQTLMSRNVLPLEVLGLLLTAALIGAVIIAMPERGNK